MTFLQIARMQSLQVGTIPHLRVARMQSAQLSVVATVSAGADQANVEPGDVVTLTGAITGVSSGYTLLWEQAGESQEPVTLISPTTITTSFLAPAVPSPGDPDIVQYRFSLIMTHPDIANPIVSYTLVDVRPHTIFTKVGSNTVSGKVNISA